MARNFALPPTLIPCVRREVGTVRTPESLFHHWTIFNMLGYIQDVAGRSARNMLFTTCNEVNESSTCYYCRSALQPCSRARSLGSHLVPFVMCQLSRIKRWFCPGYRCCWKQKYLHFEVEIPSWYYGAICYLFLLHCYNLRREGRQHRLYRLRIRSCQKKLEVREGYGSLFPLGVGAFCCAGCCLACTRCLAVYVTQIVNYLRDRQVVIMKLSSQIRLQVKQVTTKFYENRAQNA